MDERRLEVAIEKMQTGSVDEEKALHMTRITIQMQLQKTWGPLVLLALLDLLSTAISAT